MTIAVVLDKKRMTTTGENAGRFHIKVRLTYTKDKKTFQKYFKTNIYATDKEFEKILGNPGKDLDLKSKQSKVSAIREKAKSILENNPYINPEDFEQQLLSKGSLKSPLGFMLAYAEELEEAGRIGSRDSYIYAHNSLKDYFGEHVTFASISAKKLLNYEAWMIERGKSITTVGMYLRALRTVFNLARSKKRKIIPEDMYPFGRDGYQIPTSKKRKMSLTADTKDRLLKYATMIPAIRKAVDFWIFSYYGNGMNMADICHLKFKNIPDNVMSFDRAKTIVTSRNKQPVYVNLRQEMIDIIERWGNKPGDPNEYVFPILRHGLSPSQIKDRIKDFTYAVNKGLEIVCEEFKIPKITTYSARHTFSNTLRNAGVSVGIIQKMLGHGSEKTTQNYLDSLDNETLKKVSENL